MKKILVLLLTLSLCSASLISCSRVQKSSPGELKTVELKKADSIPLEYGSLVGVTANLEAPNWAQLWFEDNTGTVRVVSVGFFDNKMLKNVTVIPRN